jgi:hypothetical protein
MNIFFIVGDVHWLSASATSPLSPKAPGQVACNASLVPSTHTWHLSVHALSTAHANVLVVQCVRHVQLADVLCNEPLLDVLTQELARRLMAFDEAKQWRSFLLSNAIRIPPTAAYLWIIGTLPCEPFWQLVRPNLVLLRHFVMVDSSWWCSWRIVRGGSNGGFFMGALMADLLMELAMLAAHRAPLVVRWLQETCRELHTLVVAAATRWKVPEGAVRSCALRLGGGVCAVGSALLALVLCDGHMRDLVQVRLRCPGPSLPSQLLCARLRMYCLRCFANLVQAGSRRCSRG